MATAYAGAAWAASPGKKVAIGDGKKSYWSEVFWRNPILAAPADVRFKRLPFQWVVHASGCRPYIDYDKMLPSPKKSPRFYWREGMIVGPGIVVFSEEEQAPLADGDYVVIEPHVKSTRPNKDWGFEKFQAVVQALPHVRFVQPDYGKTILEGVEPVRTQSFRDLCRLVRDATGYLGPEGGGHHAAAAVATPAVVIYGGFTSPAVSGYETQINLFTGGEPCGMRDPCDHCKEAMGDISPDRVVGAVARMLSCA